MISVVVATPYLFTRVCWPFACFFLEALASKYVTRDVLAEKDPQMS